MLADFERIVTNAVKNLPHEEYVKVEKEFLEWTHYLDEAAARERQRKPSLASRIINMIEENFGEELQNSKEDIALIGPDGGDSRIWTKAFDCLNNPEDDWEPDRFDWEEMRDSYANTFTETVKDCLDSEYQPMYPEPEYSPEVTKEAEEVVKNWLAKKSNKHNA